MTLTLIRKVEKDELLENIKYKDNGYLNNIYGSIDHGRLCDEDKEELQDFVFNILKDNDKIVNDYYTYECDIEEEIYSKLRYLRNDYYDFEEFVDKYMSKYWHPSNSDVWNELYNYLQSKDIKGIRNNTPLLKLVGLYLKSKAWGNDEISRVLEKLQYKVNKKYIVNISNAGYSQLTSSYTDNYSSCYELSDGGYRASNIFLMGDHCNYVIKIFKYDDDNVARIEDDTLKVSRDVISRYNMYCTTIDDKQYIIVNKVYGSYEFMTSQDHRPLTKELLAYSLSEYSNNELLCDQDCENRLENGIYCRGFHGYEDYECNVRYRNIEDRSEYSKLNIGDKTYITWDIYETEMIMVYGQMYTCECCGYETEYEDDLRYCEDTDDYRCPDCCWYCDYDNCYYSYNTRYIETPDGNTYKADDCYISQY